MKIRNWVFCVLFLSVASNQAYAQSEDAYASALQVCQNAPTYEMIDRCKGAVGSRSFFERAVLEVCKLAPTWDMIISCFGAGAGKTEPKAVQVCKQAPTWDQIVGCFGSIADRQYVETDLNDCQRRPTWDSIVSCFRISGRPASGTTLPINYVQMRAEIRRAIQQIKSGQGDTAVQTLERVLIDLP